MSPYRVSPEPARDDDEPSFALRTSPAQWAFLITLAISFMSTALTSDREIFQIVAPIATVATPVAGMMAIVVPSIREFFAVRRARREAGWH